MVDDEKKKKRKKEKKGCFYLLQQLYGAAVMDFLIFIEIDFLRSNGPRCYNYCTMQLLYKIHVGKKINEVGKC